MKGAKAEMNIVVLEARSLGDDVSFQAFERYGAVTVYRETTKEEMPERIRDADIVVANKVPFCEETLRDAENLKMVCLTATGINNIDGAYLKSRGIAAYHVAGYSTDAVAQHTFAILFYVLEKLSYYDGFVKSGEYSRGTMFSHFGKPFFELAGKTWGILGLGAIGRKVAQIAEAFGCRVICCSASGRTYDTKYEQVDFEELLRRSDVLSAHAPLNEFTQGIFDGKAFSMMKPSALFVNVARGGLVDEDALYTALTQGQIAGAALDVLREEPLPADSPLLKIQNSERLVITPHIGWAPVETRRRCLEMSVENVGRFLRGDMENRVY